MFNVIWKINSLSAECRTRSSSYRRKMKAPNVRAALQTRNSSLMFTERLSFVTWPICSVAASALSSGSLSGTQPNRTPTTSTSRRSHWAFSRCTFAWDPFAVLLIISANNKLQAVTVTRSIALTQTHFHNRFMHESFRQPIDIQSSLLSPLFKRVSS